MLRECSADLGCFGGTCASCGLAGQPVCPSAIGHYEDVASTANFYLSGGLLHAVYAPGLPVNTNTNAATTGVHWFLNLGDAHGSTAFVIDYQTGEVVERAAYLAYGAPDTDFRPTRWGSYRASVRYGGHWDNSEVGLVYFGARYYSPLLNRFISPDPLTVHGLSGDPNPYAYAYGNPSRYVDPTGLAPEGYTPSDEALAQYWSSPEYQQQHPDPENWSPSDPQEVTPSAGDGPGGLASDFDPGGSMSDFSGLPGPSVGDIALTVGEMAQGAGAALVNLAADNFAGMMSVPGAGSFDLGAQAAGLASSLHVPVPQGANASFGYGAAMAAMAICGGLGGAEEGVSFAAEGFEVAEGAAQGASFRSFSSFKNALGPAGEGAQWHHIVEQTPGNLARFGPGPIQNTGNLIRLDVATHQQISGFYSSIQPFTGGATVRSWLSTQSFEIQQQFGQEVLLRFGVSF